MSLEFESFFNEIRDDHLMMLKRDSHLLNTILVMSKNGQVTFAPLVVMVEQISPFEVARSVIEQTNPDFYMVIAMAWGSKSIKRENIDNVKRGDISRLPADQRFEIISFIGRTRDGKQELKYIYEVKREIHGDDSSKVLDIIEMKDWNEMQVFHLP